MADLLGAILPLIGQFNAQETAKMNAREARQWEEDMYNKYNSPSALVRQYQEAGINPALMFGGQTPAAPTDTAAAETIAPQTGTVTEMLGELMNLDLLGSEKRRKDAEARDLEASAAGKEFANEINKQFAVFEHQYSITEAIARINKLEEETSLTKYEREVLGPLREALLKAQARGENVSAAINEWKKDYMVRFDADPDADPLRQALSDLLFDLNNPERARKREERKQRAEDNRKNPTTPPGYSGR